MYRGKKVWELFKKNLETHIYLDLRFVRGSDGKEV